LVTAAVFNDTPNQGYSNPPNQNPFTAYYADAASSSRPKPLVADNYAVSENGGTVNLGLFAYPENAGRKYLVLGSISGTDPGTPLPGGQVILPLNLDVFTNIVFSLTNTGIFSNFLGTLDGSGAATAQLNYPPVPGSAGLFMYYAFALNGPWNFVSNPISIYVYQ
jgi:hypothetical protein